MAMGAPLSICRRVNPFFDSDFSLMREYSSLNLVFQLSDRDIID